MRISLLIALLSGSVVLALASACSSTTSTTPVENAGSCDVLATRCHAAATPLAKECHDLGHDGDDAKCGPRKAECLAECPEEAAGDDSGTSGDVDASTAVDASDAAPAADCVALCACVEATCSGQSNYPFADPGSCQTACAAFSTADRACFQSFCEKAADGGSKSHDCEHATGKLGSQECP